VIEKGNRGVTNLVETVVSERIDGQWSSRPVIEYEAIKYGAYCISLIALFKRTSTSTYAVCTVAKVVEDSTYQHDTDEVKLGQKHRHYIHKKRIKESQKVLVTDRIRTCAGKTHCLTANLLAGQRLNHSATGTGTCRERSPV
jgi:hypothetical protein